LKKNVFLITHLTGKLKKHLPIFALFQNACCEVQGDPGEKRCDSKKKFKKRIVTLEHSFLQKKNFVHTFLFEREKEF